MDEAGGSIRWIFPRCEIKLGTHKTTSSKNSNGPTSQDCDKMSTFSLPKEGLGLNEQYEQQAWQNPSPPCFGSIRFWTLATPMRIPCKTRWFARSLQLSSASRPSIACEPSGNAQVGCLGPTGPTGSHWTHRSNPRDLPNLITKSGALMIFFFNTQNMGKTTVTYVTLFLLYKRENHTH